MLARQAAEFAGQKYIQGILYLYTCRLIALYGLTRKVYCVF